jgi:hypothetical protein
MKKLGLAVALTLLVAIAVAPTAFAVDSSTWASWQYSSPNLGAGDTPHTNWQLTTVKCAVCHAVHGAVGGGEILMRDTVADACTYCHITPGVSTVIVYDGVEANYTTDFDNAHNNTGAGSTVACADCHTVHGAGAITTNGLTSKILQNLTPQAGYTPGTGSYNATVSGFCSNCHNYYVDVYDAGLPVSHIMTSPADLTTNYGNTVANAAIQGGQVAWAGSFHCLDCHDAPGTDTQADNFPHYTVAKRFLQVESYFGAGDASDASQTAQADGVCLKCHRNATNGIGVDF